jgi:endoglucanase
MEIFDAVVNALANQELLIILDNHVSTADWCCSNTDGNQLWYNSQQPQTAWLADGQGMVQRYRAQPAVVAVDLRNEPRATATWGGASQYDWHAAAQLGGNTVLSVNPPLLVMVEGINYASDLTGVAQLPITLNVPNQLVYSAHDYSWYHDGLSSYIQLQQQLDRAWG